MPLYTGICLSVIQCVTFVNILRVQIKMCRLSLNFCDVGENFASFKYINSVLLIKNLWMSNLGLQLSYFSNAFNPLDTLKPQSSVTETNHIFAARCDA